MKTTKKTTKAQYFVEVDTYWQNSKSYFVGPFPTRKDAEAWHVSAEWTPDDNTWLATSTCGGDIRSAWRIYPKPLAKTAARRRGMRRYADGDTYENVLSSHVRPQARALAQAREEILA